MEGIGSAFFLLVLLIGLVLLFKKGSRVPGLLIILFAGFFMYFIPYLNHQSMINKSEGVYLSASGEKLIVYASATFAIYDIHARQIDSGKVEYQNSDLMEMTLYGKNFWLNRKNNWEICCGPGEMSFKR